MIIRSRFIIICSVLVEHLEGLERTAGNCLELALSQQLELLGMVEATIAGDFSLSKTHLIRHLLFETLE